MDLTSNKRQRTEGERKDFGKTIVLFVLILIFVALVTGCATVLEKSVATCAGLDGSWEYTRAGEVEKFRCDRPAALSTRAAR